MVRNQLFMRFRRGGDGRRYPLAPRYSETVSTPTRRSLPITRSAHAPSRERFKSVLDGESHGVFQGKIVVEPQAQKTDAKMLTRALLLSETAEADNKPELEIFADDVVCGHGATAGGSRRGPAVLPQGARHSAEGSRGAVDPGLRRRSDRRHRACGPARRVDGSRRRVAPGTRIVTGGVATRMTVKDGVG